MKIGFELLHDRITTSKSRMQLNLISHSIIGLLLLMWYAIGSSRFLRRSSHNSAAHSALECDYLSPLFAIARCEQNQKQKRRWLGDGEEYVCSCRPATEAQFQRDNWRSQEKKRKSNTKIACKHCISAWSMGIFANVRKQKCFDLPGQTWIAMA